CAEGRVLRVEHPLRGEYQLAELAPRTPPAVARGDEARAGASDRRRMRDGHGESAAGEHRHVGKVVADVSARDRGQLELTAQRFPWRDLVLGALGDARD